jgi:hypothetical protein
MTTKIPLAICGYRLGRMAYVPYTGSLTEAKYLKIKAILDSEGFTFGWKCRNVSISDRASDGMVSYREDGAGGVVKEVKVFQMDE